ncbi:Protein of unknown function [Clostridium cavendishii DSM 21758]|uniref:DUF2975 domain-containing protein n=1 Tax=Clostridium cavendishii DSM 21758 TaxID=1121302 RepID=A0A1M6ERZ1_9CLOT|nr:DUF2975 domain-containing protein [Clostridium cavendishii]SHI88153.1 Protein of unknown function [Clostridium cavendishii DSM 21758]
MKYYGKKSMAAILNGVLTLTLVLGVIGAGCILYYTIFKIDNGVSTGKQILLITLLAVGISCVFLIVFQLKKVLLSLVNEKPFIKSNVILLRKISIECYTIALCYIINFMVNSNLKEFQFIYVDQKGIHTDMEFIIFIFAGLFIAILSKVFNQAVEYKEENDFTI